MNFSIRTLALVMFLLSGAAATCAQTLENPKVEYANDMCELRHENRVFVQAPLNTRAKIVKELRAHSDLFITERPEEASYLLIFAYTPLVEGINGGIPLNGSASAAHAELTVVKFVNYRVGEARPRILYYWGDEKPVHIVPIPLRSMTTDGFSHLRSGKSVVEELIARFALWAVGKKWPDTFHFDQFTNQLTISTSGKLEKKEARAFLKALKESRSDSYAYRCTASAQMPSPADSVLASSFPRNIVHGLPAKVAVPSPTLPAKLPRAQPPIKSQPPYGDRRPRTFKRTKKGRKDR